MNKNRRKEIEGAMELLDRAKEIIECCAGDERDAFDNLPESIQYAETGERMEENADSLDEAADSVQDVIDTLQEIIEQ